VALLPAQPLYTNPSGQGIFWIDGANTAPRPDGRKPSVLVIHDTAGTDSRQYLANNDRGVSAHYLVGEYPDCTGPRIYKYASEAKRITHTQGPGRLGGIRASNINEVAISIEIETPMLSSSSLSYAALLAQEVLRGWQQVGVDLIMLPHRIIQADKYDPRLNWSRWCTMVYS
jgi:N-acetyl-anhydromuramyl-L-alanine amidase AmpD